MKAKVCIAVCTCMRPLMLAACLQSLRRLQPVEGVETVIVVVDNDPSGQYPAELEPRKTAARSGAVYIAEPVRGIPQARNAALNAARAMGATHLAFIDDDETAARTWLLELWKAMDFYGADVVAGRVHYVYPEDAESWRCRSEFNAGSRPSGTILPLAATNNVLFKLSSCQGISFPLDRQLIGGEDTVFFATLKMQGAKIVFSQEAQVYETVPWERITLLANTRKAFHKGSRTVLDAGIVGTRRKPTVWKLIRRFITGTSKLAVAPLLIVLGPSMVIRTVMSGCRAIAFCAGCTAGLLGAKTYEYYQRPAGY